MKQQGITVIGSNPWMDPIDVQLCFALTHTDLLKVVADESLKCVLKFVEVKTT